MFQKMILGSWSHATVWSHMPADQWLNVPSAKPGSICHVQKSANQTFLTHLFVSTAETPSSLWENPLAQGLKQSGLVCSHKGAGSLFLEPRTTFLVGIFIWVILSLFMYYVCTKATKCGMNWSGIGPYYVFSVGGILTVEDYSGWRPQYVGANREVWNQSKCFLHSMNPLVCMDAFVTQCGLGRFICHDFLNDEEQFIFDDSVWMWRQFTASIGTYLVVLHVYKIGILSFIDLLKH